MRSARPLRVLLLLLVAVVMWLDGPLRAGAVDVSTLGPVPAADRMPASGREGAAVPSPDPTRSDPGEASPERVGTYLAAAVGVLAAVLLAMLSWYVKELALGVRTVAVALESVRGELENRIGAGLDRIQNQVGGVSERLGRLREPVDRLASLREEVEELVQWVRGWQPPDQGVVPGRMGATEEEAAAADATPTPEARSLRASPHGAVSGLPERCGATGGGTREWRYEEFLRDPGREELEQASRTWYYDGLNVGKLVQKMAAFFQEWASRSATETPAVFRATSRVHEEFLFVARSHGDGAEGLALPVLATFAHIEVGGFYRKDESLRDAERFNRVVTPAVAVLRGGSLELRQEGRVA